MTMTNEQKERNPVIEVEEHLRHLNEEQSRKWAVGVRKTLEAKWQGLGLRQLIINTVASVR